MSYSEDDLTNGLIHHYQDAEFVHVMEPEAFYNDYGMRGFPDLHMVYEWIDDGIIESQLIEVKSEYAVKRATGANEIIRQFNKMRRHFYKAEGQVVPMRQFEWQEIFLGFELAFIPSEYTLLHILDNKEMYNQAIQTSQGNVSRLPRNQNREGTMHSGIQVLLSFRHPEQPDRPISLVSVSGQSLETTATLPPTPEQFSLLKEIDEDLYKRLKRILENENARESQ